MQTEETKDKGEKVKSTAFGFAPMRHGMFEMMNKCCTGQGGFPGCSTMIKEMMETMGNQPCCKPKKNAAEFKRRKK